MVDYRRDYDANDTHTHVNSDGTYYRHNDLEDDNRGSWLAGLLPLLLIPLLAGLAYFGYQKYKENNNGTAYNSNSSVVTPVNGTSPTPTTGVQLGVGGAGYSVSVSPSPSVSPMMSPSPMSSSNTMKNGTGTVQGIGGSGMTNSNMPKSAPDTGMGAMAQ